MNTPSFVTLDSVDAVLDKLGGNGAVMAITGVTKPQVVSNWRMRRRIPPRYFTVMTDALAARHMSAPRSLWGMISPDDALSA